MTKVRFGIDIDGTVTCPAALLPHINERFGSNLVLDDIKEYDLTEAFDVDKQLFSQWYKETEELIYRTSPAAQFAKEILSLWQDRYELFYITARGENVRDCTFEWFQEHGIPYDHIELVGTHNKIEAAKRHDVKAFFEDKYDNAIELHEELNIPVFLFDAPYNRKPIPEGIIRVTNWREAQRWIDQLFPVYENVRAKQ